MSVRMLLVGCLGLFIPAVALGQGTPATPPAPAPVAAPAAAPAEAAPVAPAAEPMPAPVPAPEPALMPVPTQPEPVTPVIAEPLPNPAAPEATPPEAPRKLAVGTEGLFQPGLLLQGWFLLGRSDETTTTYFRLRRAEFSAKGDMVPGSISYALMIDPAKILEPRDAVLPVTNQDPAASDPDLPESVTAKQPVSAVSVLQDAFITFQSEYLDTSVGQFKIPVSWEGYNSSSKLLFAERALASKEYGDKRDLGLRLAKTFEYFGYSAGIFNGAGLNNLDTDNAKDGALRFEGYPVKDMVLAGVVYATLWDRKQAGAKDRFELDARYDLGPVLIQAEYLRASDAAAGKAAVDGQGFYAAVAVRLLENKLEPALRVGYLDPNVDADVNPVTAKGKDEVWHIEGGLTYYVQKQEAKLLLNYGHFAYGDKQANNEVTAAAQLSF